MTTRRLALPLLVACLASAACGRLNGAGGGSPAIAHPTRANDLVVRVEHVGGFVSPEVTLTSFPEVSLYGDGALITQGAQTEIYPGPALPSLFVQHLSEDGVQTILRAAREDGLTDGDRTYAAPCAADVPLTRFTVVAGGRTSVVTAAALAEGSSGGCAGSDSHATDGLSAFTAKLADFSSWLPAGSLGAEEPYEPSRLRVYVRRYQRNPDLEEPAISWPGAPLASGGTPVKADPALRCVMVDGADAPDVLRAARRANQLTPWLSGGDRYTVIFRPLLPDETGC